MLLATAVRSLFIQAGVFHIKKYKPLLDLSLRPNSGGLYTFLNSEDASSMFELNKVASLWRLLEKELSVLRTIWNAEV